MKEIYQLTKEELFERFGGSNGLNEDQVSQRLQEYGENVLKEQGKKSVMAVFLGQFADLLVVILVIAAVVSMLSGNVESTIVIFAVIILNAVLGTVQYVKAEKSLDSLKELSAPKAKVLRDGIKKEIESKEIVPGDVLQLEAGDMIVADGRIIANYSLQVNESALTGESTNVEKKEEEISGETALGDRYNMVFSGSLVTYGRADVLVTATGMDTEMGKIAALMNNTQNKKTPLQVSLDDFSKKLAIVIMAVSVVVFGLRFWQGDPILDSLMFAVALAVAAIPEALSSIVTIVQAMGTRKMAADNAIMKDLKAVESLGCVSVICSDKTGTLTQNRMTVKEIYLDDKCILPEELDLTVPLHRYFLYTAILNNDSVLRDGKGIGDPTETCLLNMARKSGLLKAGASEEDIRSMMPRMEEIPFDSERKLMSTKYRVHGVPTVFTKGAVDVLLERMDYIATSAGSRAITEADKEKIKKQNWFFSENGLRVLAFAYRECKEDEILTMENEYGYTFVGLVSMIDPPREESKEAVSDAVRAGIKPVMITGDHKVTAAAIAKQIGIYRDGDLAVTGQELDKMPNEELDAVLEKISVYARVSPENKIRIVDAWQKKGHVTAMTGDGVNDAPALKKADIGIAMGITGTEVSKDASAMILSDDNFATIIKAVLNGRNVYRNILNAIQFLLSGNTAAIIVVLFCSLMALDTPFEPVHLLFINLLTDSLPALAIGMEPSDKMLLKKKPRDPKEGIITKDFSLKLLGYGLFIAAATLVAYYTGLSVSSRTASTMAFATLTLARLFHGFNCRSEFSIFKIGIRSNMWSVAAFSVGVLLLGFVLFVPFMHSLFMVTALTGVQVGCIAVLACVPTVVIQMARRMNEGNQIFRRTENDKEVPI
ncbi:MAG: cation-translocating P-type ATPase [Lachnospiraceae bacterium]|nr:cation-translocating P-type ATPase [Lachnospiraceae bacterium]